MPPPLPANPSDIPTDIPTGTLILSHFANLKLTGDRLVHDTVTLLQTTAATTLPASSPAHHHVPRRRRRPRRPARSTRVHRMSDADLEAELAARRAARARERDRYARAIRSEKLSVLENELTRLRSELSRMDRTSGIGAGTPPTARWEALPDRRRSVTPAMPSTPLPGPPPPPPPPAAAADDVVVDPERRRREKEERQRRREAKRREREANRKPLTLAEIIKSAGPDPIKRLKPPGSIPVPDVHAPQEEQGADDIKGAKDALKKVSTDDHNRDKQNSEGDATVENPAEEDPKDGDNKESAENADVSNERTEESGDLNSDDKQDGIHADPKPAENQSPTKVTNTASSSPEKPKSPDKAKSPINTSPTRNTPQQTDADSEIEPASQTKTERNDDNATNGTPNGSVDALAALSKLKAKLPDKTTDANGKNDTGERKRVSVEEKRRLRRAAKEKDATGDRNVLNLE